MGKSWEARMSGGASSAIDYEVFLSYRVEDTGQGFTDCLYHLMLDANIRVFLGKEGIRIGKEIADEPLAAIEKSRIYIPIFSKGYASSSWCLRELGHMVECRKSKPSENEIMPIFYDVGSYYVGLQSNLYVGALEAHEKKYGRQTRAKWEDALKSVAKIEGWELKEQGVADTGQGFTDCLYRAMLEANIRVFLGQEELHVGKEIADELPAAIEKWKKTREVEEDDTFFNDV